MSDFAAIQAIVNDPAKKVAEITDQGNAIVVAMNNLVELDFIDDEEFTIRKSEFALVEKLKDDGGVKIYFANQEPSTFQSIMVEGVADNAALYQFFKNILLA